MGLRSSFWRRSIEEGAGVLGHGEVVEAEGIVGAMDRWASGGAEVEWWGEGRGGASRCYALRNTHVNTIANRQLRVKRKVTGGDRTHARVRNASVGPPGGSFADLR